MELPQPKWSSRPPQPLAQPQPAPGGQRQQALLAGLQGSVRSTVRALQAEAVAASEEGTPPQLSRLLTRLSKTLQSQYLAIEAKVRALPAGSGRQILQILTAPLVPPGDQSSPLAQVLTSLLPYLPPHESAAEFWATMTAPLLSMEGAESFLAAWEEASRAQAESAPVPQDRAPPDGLLPSRKRPRRGSIAAELLPAPPDGGAAAGSSSQS